MNLLGGFVFFTMFIVVNVANFLWWIVSNAWWAILFFYLYTLFKPNAPK
jgi:hypothetical protein